MTQNHIPEAPDDLVGPIHKRTSDELKLKRMNWINEQRRCGYTDSEIAFALKVSPSSICYFMSRRTMGRRLWSARNGVKSHSA